MELQIFYHILAGLIFFGACSLAFASPVPQTGDSFDSLDGIQNDDDYDYSDDESMPSSNTRSTVASPTSGMVPFFEENDLTVSTILGKNATLECNAKNLSESNVILWYKNNTLVTTGREVLSPEYALDRTNFALTIMSASGASQGEYFCEVQPQKIRLHTTLVVSEHPPIEALVPESSKSSQESLYFKSTTSLFTSSVIGIFLFLRI